LSTKPETSDIPHPYVERKPGVQGGRPVIKGSRFRVSALAHYYRQCMDIADILHEWRTLKPAEVFDALSYYHDHKAEIDAEIEEMNDIESAMRRYPPTLLPQDDGRRSNLL